MASSSKDSVCYGYSLEFVNSAPYVASLAAVTAVSVICKDSFYCASVRAVSSVAVVHTLSSPWESVRVVVVVLILRW